MKSNGGWYKVPQGTMFNISDCCVFISPPHAAEPEIVVNFTQVSPKGESPGVLAERIALIISEELGGAR